VADLLTVEGAKGSTSSYQCLSALHAVLAVAELGRNCFQAL